MSANNVTQADIAAVLQGLVKSFESDIAAMAQADLERHWHFEWNPSKSIEANTYQFHRMLELYGGFCRRWEERHHGSCCVVERVRDAYLMPKIRSFLADLQAHLPTHVAADKGNQTNQEGA